MQKSAEINNIKWQYCPDKQENVLFRKGKSEGYICEYADSCSGGCHYRALSEE